MLLLRRLALFAVLTIAVGASATAAWTYWDGFNEVLHGAGVAGTTTIGSGAVPTVGRAGGTSAVLSWGATTLSNSRAADGYVIRRYESESGVEAPVGAGCSGRLVARTCTEDGMATGAWRYTVTPVFADHWIGAESSRSGAVSVGAATLTLVKTLFGPPLPTETTGSVTGFAPRESIAYSFGPPGAQTTISGAPTSVDGDGSAAITALTIPSAPDGSHSVRVTGRDSGIVATAGIVTDVTPPVLTGTITPRPNAAGWNRTSIEASGSADDGNGSGISWVRTTNDGSDPRTSPTAKFFYGEPVTHTESATLRFYGADFAGNETEVQTMQVKIDTTPPVFYADLVDKVGGSFAAKVETTPPGLVTYRGAAAGSFRLKFTFIDDGGSPAASIGTSELVGAATGFTHEPSEVALPEGGPYVTNAYSWLAGTTSSPTGTISVTDLAGNTLVLAGNLNNDSTAPTGGSVDATGLGGTGGRYAGSTTLDLALDPGPDAGSVTSGAKLLRASATLASTDGLVSGSCGTFGAFAQVGADDPAATVSDTVPDERRCYRYAYTVADQVGNVGTFTSPDIKVQASPAAPLAPTIAQIVPVNGLVAQFVVGSTVYYKPLQTGSFTVATSVSDNWSGVAHVGFPALGGFSGGGEVTTASSGTVFHTHYSWANNAGSGSPGSQTITATDHAGRSLSTEGAFSVVQDAAGPTHVLSLTAATRAYLSGNSLYYRPNTSGSFKIVDALDDDASGPLSATFPTLGLSGWSHSTQTVSTPAGGPFTSSTFSWSSYPSSPGSYTITGRDKLNTTSTRVITFTGDQSPPSGNTITYFNGIVTTPSVALTLFNGTDGASGINAASGIVRRDQATLNTTSNSCGSFANTFATTVTPVGGADTSVSTARCYKYRHLISDNVGNQATYTSSTVVKVKIG